MIGGQTIARIVLEGYVTILLDLPNGDLVVMKQVGTSRSESVGSYSNKSGIRIIGIEGQGRSVVAPAPEEMLMTGDNVVATGETEQLKKFIHQL
jgi:K+/H+ antiporter YhaU regulatory subunit KhtT